MTQTPSPTPLRIVHYNAGGPEFTGREFQYDAHHVHMIDELRRRGHEVLHVNPAALLGRYGTPEDYRGPTVAAVRDFQARGGCDLFFATAVDHSFAPDTARDISALGIPTVNLGMDDYSHPYRVKEVTPAFDLVWTTEPANAHIIRGYGPKKLIHMPFAANPHTFRPEGEERERAFCFIGACYGARARAIALLAQAGLPVRVYGKSPMDIYGEGTSSKSLPAVRALFAYRDGWHRVANSMKFSAGRACVRGAITRTVQNVLRDLPEKHPKAGDVEYRPGPSYDDMPAVFGSTALSLGSTELASTFVLKQPLYFLRFREFEAAMSGAAHVVPRGRELENYYAADREMIFFDGFDDLLDKGRFWLDPKQDSARRKIREAARARSLAEHTWSHRFRKLFESLGIPATV